MRRSAEQRLSQVLLLGSTALLTGLSGSGKSHMLTSLCQSLKPATADLVVIDINVLTSSPSAGILRAIESHLEQASTKRTNNDQRCIVCIDNIHLMFPKPGSNGTFTQVNGMCRLIRGIKDRFGSDFVLVATAPAKDAVNVQIVQALDVVIQLGSPVPAERAVIFRQCLGEAQQTILDEGKALERVLDATNSFLPCDIIAAVKKAHSIARLENGGCRDMNYRLTVEHLLQSIASITPAEVLHQQSTRKSTQQRQGSSSNTSSKAKSQGVRWKDIGGMASVKEQLQSILNWQHHPRHRLALQRLGVSRPSTGALLWGKPGTGKTLIASACATESSSNFIPVSIPELVHGAIGESEKAIARLFESARRLAPCIVFLDEIDAVFGSRDGKDGSNSGSYGSKIVSQLMRELDVIADYNQRQFALMNDDDDDDDSSGGSGANAGCVIVIGATNLPDTIDSAVTRPGRLDCIIHVPPPTRDDRLDILKVVCSSITLDPSTDLEAVADAAEELTGSDLKAIASIAALDAYKHSSSLHPQQGPIPVMTDHLLRAIQSLRRSS